MMPSRLLLTIASSLCSTMEASHAISPNRRRSFCSRTRMRHTKTAVSQTLPTEQPRFNQLCHSGVLSGIEIQCPIMISGVASRARASAALGPGSQYPMRTRPTKPGVTETTCGVNVSKSSAPAAAKVTAAGPPQDRQCISERPIRGRDVRALIVTIGSTLGRHDELLHPDIRGNQPSGVRLATK